MNLSENNKGLQLQNKKALPIWVSKLVFLSGLLKIKASWIIYTFSCAWIPNENEINYGEDNN